MNTRKLKGMNRKGRFQRRKIKFETAKRVLNDTVLKFVKGNDEAFELLYEYVDSYPTKLQGKALDLLLSLLPKEVDELTSYFDDLKDNHVAIQALKAAIKIREVMHIV